MKIHNIRLNSALRDFLWEKQILPKPWPENADLSGLKRIAFSGALRVEPYSRHMHRPAQMMTIISSGYMSYAHSPLCKARIGAFCSIAVGSQLMGDQHPYQRVSSHMLSYGGYYKDLARELGAKECRLGSARPTPSRSRRRWCATMSGSARRCCLAAASRSGMAR